jgi:hypothetical protein
MGGRVLSDWAGRVRGHFLEDRAKSLDDDIVIDFTTGHP